MCSPGNSIVSSVSLASSESFAVCQQLMGKEVKLLLLPRLGITQVEEPFTPNLCQLGISQCYFG